MGYQALIRANEPHCPKCRGKPVADQHALTENEINNLSARAAQQVRAKRGLAYECGICSAIYSYRHGFSTFICYG
jgi:predicted Zn-dependent peptidase